MEISNTKIVVVDDRKEDVEKLLNLFNKKGIPCNYYFQDARMSNLPNKPLKNIRLLFLDFVLGSEGQREESKISILFSVLQRVIHKDNGPYVLLAWTLHNGNKNNDLITPFKLKLYGNTEIPKPIAIIDLDKISVMDNLHLINGKLEQTFNGSNVFEVLFDWESKGKIALADVLKTINDISIQNISVSPTCLEGFCSSLRKSIERNMYQFAVSISGKKNIHPDNGILIDAQLPLGGIFQDYLETYIMELTSNLKRLSKKIYAKKNPEFSDPERAQMNTFFLLSKNPEAKIKPGNIYRTASIFKGVDPNGRVKFQKKDFYNKEKISSDIKNNKPDVSKELGKRVIPILIEVTPECDYVQQNWRGARFIFGVLWPVKFSNNVNTEKYIKQAGEKIFHRIPVNYNHELYFLMFHSDYQCILPLSLVKFTKPILRARKELLTDIQHWSAMHASRPGKTEF
jgi:hypothetical protein